LQDVVVDVPIDNDKRIAKDLYPMLVELFRLRPYPRNHDLVGVMLEYVGVDTLKEFYDEHPKETLTAIMGKVRAVCMFGGGQTRCQQALPLNQLTSARV
jgi:hypothetical protein